MDSGIGISISTFETISVYSNTFSNYNYVLGNHGANDFWIATLDPK
jgi:hypothetical protein